MFWIGSNQIAKTTKKGVGDVMSEETNLNISLNV